MNPHRRANGGRDLFPSGVVNEAVVCFGREADAECDMIQIWRGIWAMNKSFLSIETGKKQVHSVRRAICVTYV